jgi:hypothetical protein
VRSLRGRKIDEGMGHDCAKDGKSSVTTVGSFLVSFRKIVGTNKTIFL